jgi:hypothetical protein
MHPTVLSEKENHAVLSKLSKSGLFSKTHGEELRFFENEIVCYPFIEIFLLPFAQPGQTQDLRSYVPTNFCTCRMPIVTNVVIELVNLSFNEY